jgi:hypothetical protein
MTDAAFEALKLACHRQVAWLQDHATAYEQGKCRHLKTKDGVSHDVSMQTAEEFRHQASNIQAVISAYERLRIKHT